MEAVAISNSEQRSEGRNEFFTRIALKLALFQATAKARIYISQKKI